MPDKFDEIMDQWDEGNDAAARARRAAESDQAAFVTSFEQWATDTAVPALEVFAERLRGRGHEASVEFVSSGDAKKRSVHPGEKVPLLQLRCLPAEEVERGVMASRSTLVFTVTRDRKVSVHQAPGGRMVGTGDPDRSVPLEQLSADKVQAMAMDLIMKTFPPRRTVEPPQG